MTDLRIVVDLIVGSGLLGMFMFYESKKRKERAAARNSELQNVSLVLEQKNSYIEDLKNEQTDLKREKEELRTELKESHINESKERNKVVTLYKQLSNLGVEKVKMKEQIAVLTFHRCNVQDCSKRCPPRAYSDDKE